MKKNAVLWGSIALLWVAVLILSIKIFYSSAAASEGSKRMPSTNKNGFSMAYFILDSLETNYEYLLSLKRTIEVKQTVAQNDLIKMERDFQQKVKVYQEKVSTMTPLQAENAQRDLYELQRSFEEKKQETQSNLLKGQADFIKKVQKSIEDYIQGHTDKYPYDLIIAAQPGIVFYKNKAYDITSTLVNDLNAFYRSK